MVQVLPSSYFRANFLTVCLNVANDMENTNSGVPFVKFYDFPNYSLSIGN